MSAPYSQLIVTNEFATTSGQLAIDENGSLVGSNDIKAQTTKALENLINVLKSGKFEKKNITSITVFLTDIERDFSEFNKAYVDFFGSCKPCRATVGAALVKPEFLIEIKAEAHLQADNTVK